MSGKQEGEVSYHMTEPRRISMCEQRKLVDNVASLLGEGRQCSHGLTSAT
jgi:hypothetical protein